jgi:hypothetical protein
MLKNIALDIPLGEARAIALRGRLAGKAFAQIVTMVAWTAKPCWFIETTEDRVVGMELQTAEAKRREAKTTGIQSSRCRCAHI